jgi:hypothetical protein
MNNPTLNKNQKEIIMKQVIMLTVISILIFSSQSDAQYSELTYKKNQVYLELGGCGLTYSINYERLLTEDFALRGGIGITPGWLFVDGTIFTIPVTGSYLIGNGSSKLELGLGATYLTTTDISVFGLPAGSSYLIAFDGIIGYRLGSPYGGFIFRIAFNPMYSADFDPEFIPYGLISFGYGF